MSKKRSTENKQRAQQQTTDDDLLSCSHCSFLAPTLAPKIIAAASTIFSNAPKVLGRTLGPPPPTNHLWTSPCMPFVLLALGVCRSIYRVQKATSPAANSRPMHNWASLKHPPRKTRRPQRPQSTLLCVHLHETRPLVLLQQNGVV